MTVSRARRDLLAAAAILLAAWAALVRHPPGAALRARVSAWIPADLDTVLLLALLGAVLAALVAIRHARRLRRDVTDLASARAALEGVEAQDRLLFDRSPQPMWLYDEETLRFLAVNEAAVEQYGYTRGEFLQMTIRDIRPADQLAQLEEVLGRTQASRHARLVRHRTKDGTTIDVDLHSHRVVFDRRKARLVLASDVTSRERAVRALRESEARLQASEARFRQLAENIPSVFYLYDATTRRMLYVSPAYEVVWGQPRETLHADPRAFLHLVHPADRARAAAHFAASTAGPSEVEYRLLRADGSLRWVGDRSFPVRDAAGRVTSVAGIATDITDRRRLEQDLLQAQKLESIGRLAGGVAHDFNNLLTVILSRVALMIAEAPEAQFAGELRDVRVAAERAATLTQQLLTFARRQVLAPRVVDLAASVARLADRVRAIAGDRIAVELLPGIESALVRVDPDALEQIVLNLAANAADAMPEGGVLGIAVHRDESLPFQTGEEDQRAGVCLEVSDTGTGIPADVMPHIFEPFFTTKTGGHGTGLGLAAVHGLVRQAGGEIRVTSEHGVGTCFSVWLPVAGAGLPGAQVGAPDNTATEAAGATRGATVLVVEDEPAVRSIACRVLASAGYRVLDAADGQTAIDLAMTHKGSIDLLLSDVIMPHMGGYELAARFRTLRPATRVLLTSGYTQDWSLLGSGDGEGPAFLPKPYAPTALLEKVREVMGDTVTHG